MTNEPTQSQPHAGATLEDLLPGASLTMSTVPGSVEIVAVKRHGTQAATVTYRTDTGDVADQMLFRSDEGTFTVSAPELSSKWTFDGDGRLFRLAAEARRIDLAHLFDPYVALTSSTVEPLPHQIEAVYGHLLEQQPLRFLLADDPGAGKTIMAGLYIKELMIRGDLERCLIVAPGSLTRQWQEELREKFDLRFDILTKHDLDSLDTIDVFADKPRLIARVDQLARRTDELGPRLAQLDWDLVVVDEAHRMSAHFYSAEEIKKTQRFQLGELLGATARHLLLMTATPHNGKEEDFQLFLSLLDSDRFAGRFRDGVHAIDPSDLMRRMVKERLVRFDGKPLFPERRSYTVRYELSDDEMTLYDEVTDYVRDQMNAADRLRQEGDGRRGNTVGFALTILQRRLASSPEAIYQSLHRRRRRLEQRIVDERQAARAARLGLTVQQDRLSTLLQIDPAELPNRPTGHPTASSNQDRDRGQGEQHAMDEVDLDAYDDLDDDERDEIETEVVDAATAAATVEQLEKEIATLQMLERLAFDLRESGVDRKWQELSEMLSETAEMFTPNGERRKLIIFTEHRDTLNYLVDRLRTFLGSHDAVVHISGGTTRDERRVIQQRFTQDKDTIVLVATDAAGEGINLQQAHLVVNYDLPWNPNRIEQRFGRVHRIGQTEVCHMWNLVADQTREAQVYLRLLEKIERMRATFKGQVYDVLGEAMSGRELRNLLLDAIRYGDQPAVRDRINQVIEHDVEARVQAAINEPILAQSILADHDRERIRRDMEEAALRRLQPHYVKAFFAAALADLGGQMEEREPDRFEIDRIPPSVVERDRRIGTGTPVSDRYHRITFEKDLVTVPGTPMAGLIAPGHPLLDAVIDLTLERHRHHLTTGAVMVDDADLSTEPRVMLMLEHEVANSVTDRGDAHTVVSRRFEFVEIPTAGDPWTAAYAPYLDYRPVTDTERDAIEPIVDKAWLGAGIDEIGMDHAIAVAVPNHIEQVKLRTEAKTDAVKAAVHQRLTREINYWDNRAAQLAARAAGTDKQRLNINKARGQAEKLAERLKTRSELLDRERALKALPPRVVGAALVIPAGMLPAPAHESVDPVDQLARQLVEERAVNAVLAAETAAGRQAQDMNEVVNNHPGYDIRSVDPSLGGDPAATRFIEVKGRTSGATTVTVSRNEILTGLNEPDNYVLALVEVHPSGGETVRYLWKPFHGRSEDSLFNVASVNFEWAPLWEKGQPPS